MSTVRKGIPRKAYSEERPVDGRGGNWLWFAGGMLVALLIAGLAFGAARMLQPSTASSSSGAQEVANGPRPGQQAPDFQLQTIGGEKMSLAQYRGKPVLINFWASWCPPCKAEMPDIEKSYQKHQTEGLVVLGVDEEEDLPTIQQFLKDRGFGWNFLLDPNGDIGNVYKVDGLPTSYFVDRTGTVRATQVGMMTSAQLEDKLGSILKQ